MKKVYKTPEIETQAIELIYMLAESQITTSIKEGEVDSSAPNLSRTQSSPYQEPSYQDDADWGMTTSSGVW